MATPASPPKTSSPSPPSDEPSDLPTTLATSLILEHLAPNTSRALSEAGHLDRDKITVHFKTLPGGTPALRQPRFKISSAQRFEAVVRFLRRRLALPDETSVFCYVNSVFAPGLDEGVGNLWRVSCHTRFLPFVFRPLPFNTRSWMLTNVIAFGCSASRLETSWL